MKEQSSFRERAKFSRRMMRSRQRNLRSPMPNEHPDNVNPFILFNHKRSVPVCILKHTVSTSRLLTEVKTIYLVRILYV